MEFKWVEKFWCCLVQIKLKGILRVLRHGYVKINIKLRNERYYAPTTTLYKLYKTCKIRLKLKNVFKTIT